MTRPESGYVTDKVGIPGRAVTDHQKDVDAVASIDIVPTILATACRVTKMGFAAVARITDDRWIACSVRDDIEFGLKPGSELPLETTICDEIRESGQAVVIDDVLTDPAFCNHHTPATYGFRSYISVPIFLEGDRFFGTLCAIDPAPRNLSDPDTIKMFEMFAQLIGSQLDQADQLAAALAQNTLNASEQDLLWKASPDLLVELDCEGHLLRVNPAWTTILGYEPEELIGRQVSTLVVPEDRALTQHALANAAEGPLLEVENRYLHKDGSTRWLSWVAAPTDHVIFATGRHITAQRQAEANLRDEQDFARLALSAVGGVGVWTYDIPSERFTCDASIAALYGIDANRGSDGFSREEFFGNVHPDDRPALEQVLSGGLRRSGELELEYRLLHPDGSTHWVLSRGHTYLDEDGRAVRRTGVGVDMTSQRQVEDQLRQSQKMEALGQLTGGIAHDFNNLLTVIRGSAELLQVPSLSEEKRRRYAVAIADTADRASKLTSQLLSFARHQALTPEVFDVAASVETLVDMLQTLAGPRITIDLRLGASDCFVNADRTQFDTAIVNMAVNARDAMNRDGRLAIEIEKVACIPAVRAHAAVRGDFVAVSLADTGSGIPKEKLDQIFEPFFTTKAVGHGTGLGLSQVFGFAKQSGGDVVARNLVAGGASFTLYLPLTSEHAITAPARSSADTTATGKGLCILVVEDNLAVGEFATQALAELDYRTRWVGSGQEALSELAASGNFDIVFTDVVMPGMSGIELGHEVRRLYPELPVVLTSGYSDAVVQSGVSGFPLLQKPYSISNLSRVIQDAAQIRPRIRTLSLPE